MFVEAEDFDVAPYQLVNLKEETNDDTPGDTIEGFTSFVEEQEEEVLRAILGDVFYEAFMVGLEEDPIAQRWVDLRDGVDYNTSNNKLRKWKGMKALLKPYIYSRWINFGSARETGIGVVVANAENAEPVNSSALSVMGHTLFCKLAGGSYCRPNSLYQYLYLSEDVYIGDVATEATTITEYLAENWDFETTTPENEFDF